MVNLSKFLFWIPITIAALSFIFFIKWTRRSVLLLLSACPMIYFIVRIMTYYFYNSTLVFLYYVIGFFVSVTFFIIVLGYFIKHDNKKRVQRRTCKSCTDL
ncbi:hypothetical protein E1H99_07720 [Enterococcus hirae]|nr:hypothetical protein E1H99_07720 [Enterococcus hirae]